MIRFVVRQHSVIPGIKIVELHDAAGLVGVIYPGAGPDDREALAIRIESRRFGASPRRYETQVVRFADDDR